MLNIEIDNEKIAEIKEALNEYSRLKKEEELKLNKILSDEEQRLKEYERSRRRRST